MLARDPDVRALDRRHLQNWWQLAIPSGLRQSPRCAILVLDRGALIHALRIGEGAISHSDLSYVGTSPSQLAAMAKELAVDGLLVVERDALANLFAVMEGQLEIGHDLPKQGVGLWQALRKSKGIHSHPSLIDLIPPLRSDALQKTFNLLVPNASTLAIYVIDEHGKRVHCSALAIKEEGAIQGAYMHPLIADLVTERELCRDFRQNYDRINRALASRLAKPSVSVFIELAAVQRILQGPADQINTEIRSRNLIIDPAPAWLQGLLGGAAIAAVATRNVKRAARFLPKSARKMAGDFAGAAQVRFKDSAANPFAMLGFDPIELLQTLRAFYAKPKP